MMALLCNGKPLPVTITHHLTTPAQRRRGLIGMAAIRPDEVLIFHFPTAGRWRSMIHSFRVRFPFAAIWLDEGGQVVDLRSPVYPWRPLILPRRPARTLIETHPDLAKRIGLADVIRWDEGEIG